MQKISRARRGLNALLEHLPHAEVASITNQNGVIRSALRASLHPAAHNKGTLMTNDMAGPWTCVDLYDMKNGRILRYGIWNSTGATYELDKDGALVDDPIIELSDEDEESSEVHLG
jgi:hypothetical protein